MAVHREGLGTKVCRIPGPGETPPCRQCLVKKTNLEIRVYFNREVEVSPDVTLKERPTRKRRIRKMSNYFILFLFGSLNQIITSARNASVSIVKSCGSRC